MEGKNKSIFFDSLKGFLHTYDLLNCPMLAISTLGKSCHDQRTDNEAMDPHKIAAFTF